MIVATRVGAVSVALVLLTGCTKRTTVRGPDIEDHWVPSGHTCRVVTTGGETYTVLDYEVRDGVLTITELENPERHDLSASDLPLSIPLNQIDRLEDLEPRWFTKHILFAAIVVGVTVVAVIGNAAFP